MDERSTDQATKKPHQAAVPSSNEQAIRLLEAWAKQSSPDDEAFWREFEDDLRRNRLNLRDPA